MCGHGSAQRRRVGTRSQTTSLLRSSFNRTAVELADLPFSSRTYARITGKCRNNRRDTESTGVTTVRLRVFLVGLFAAMLALPAGTAAGHPPGPHQPPAPGGPVTVGLEQLAHINPGAGSNADVYAYRGMAFLGSWSGKGCLSKGVRVYGLHNPRRPRHLSTFADAASDPTLAGTWTEKVIVQRVS